MLKCATLEDSQDKDETVVSEQRKEQIRKAQQRLRKKQEGEGVKDRSFKVTEDDIENARKIKNALKLKSLDAAVSKALEDLAGRLK